MADEDRDFCPESLSLLEPNTSTGELVFLSRRTGTRYPASSDHTLLASDSVGEIHSLSRFKKTLKHTAHDPVNPRMWHPGCKSCGRRLVSYQRIEDRVFYVCLCGEQWTF